MRTKAGFAAVLMLAGSALAQTETPEQHELVITTRDGERHSFLVELADEPAERARGLMYRRSLPEGEGMLFDYGVEQPVSMWMANTYVPLDMLFIEADGAIESIAERTTPLSRRSIESADEVRYVLEINAGLSDKLGIQPGDTVSGPAIEAGN